MIENQIVFLLIIILPSIIFCTRKWFNTKLKYIIYYDNLKTNQLNSINFNANDIYNFNKNVSFLKSEYNNERWDLKNNE